MDYYEILGVSPEASNKMLKMAYREMVRKYRPLIYSPYIDTKDSKEKIEQINEAYRVLSDPEMRIRYDEACRKAEARRKAQAKLQLDSNDTDTVHKHCGYCGCIIPESAAFCSYCGARAVEDDDEIVDNEKSEPKTEYEYVKEYDRKSHAWLWWLLSIAAVVMIIIALMNHIGTLNAQIDPSDSKSPYSEAALLEETGDDFLDGHIGTYSSLSVHELFSKLNIKANTAYNLDSNPQTLQVNVTDSDGKTTFGLSYTIERDIYHLSNFRFNGENVDLSHADYFIQSWYIRYMNRINKTFRGDLSDGNDVFIAVGKASGDPSAYSTAFQNHKADLIYMENGTGIFQSFVIEDSIPNDEANTSHASLKDIYDYVFHDPQWTPDGAFTQFYGQYTENGEQHSILIYYMIIDGSRKIHEIDIDNFPVPENQYSAIQDKFLQRYYNRR